MAQNIGNWFVKIEKHPKHFAARLVNHKTQERHVISDTRNTTYETALRAAASWIQATTPKADRKVGTA